MGRSSTVISNKLRKILGKLNECYSDLRITRADKFIEIIGSLPIIESGVVLDRFQIKIEVDMPYPTIIPRVFEIGGRIPKSPSRHITPSTEEACVGLKDEWALIAANYPTVVDFIEGPVRDFFIWQIIYEYYGEDRLGGWSHGGRGRLEFYQELLRTNDIEVVKSCLIHLSEEKYRPNWPCFCGSGRQVCKCHKALIINLRTKISRELAKTAWHDIAAIINTQTPRNSD